MAQTSGSTGMWENPQCDLKNLVFKGKESKLQPK